MTISGSSQIYGLIGYPVKHTLSPIMHNAWFSRLNIDAIYLPFEVRPENLEKALQALTALSMSGVNVTIPYKECCMKYLDKIDYDAELIGAVNTISVENNKLIGFNTDGRGFINSLKEVGISSKSKKVFIIGAGGAARAIGFCLVREGTESLRFYDIDKERTVKLVEAIKKRFEAVNIYTCLKEELSEQIKQSDILINATPVGLKDTDPLIVEPDWLSNNIIVYDLIYNPTQTKLMKVCKDKGIKAYNGLGMLIHQGVLSFKIWTGKDVPIDTMREVLQKQIS